MGYFGEKFHHLVTLSPIKAKANCFTRVVRGIEKASKIKKERRESPSKTPAELHRSPASCEAPL